MRNNRWVRLAAMQLCDLRPRLLLVLLAALAFYFLEPGFHQHEAPPPDVAADLGPLGLSATLANLAGLSMIILLAGFISGERRRGYHRIALSHPVNPLALFGQRWVLALAISLGAALLFLVFGQFAAWGELRGGGSGMLLALLSALAYGGLIALLSALLPRGDAWIAVLLFFFTFFWLQAISFGAEPLSYPLRQLITFLLPPQGPMQDVYEELVVGRVAWPALSFIAGYGAVMLGLAGLSVRLREWP